MAAAPKPRGSLLLRPWCWWLGHEPTHNHAFGYDGINNSDHAGEYVCPGACKRCGRSPLSHAEAFGPVTYWRVRRWLEGVDYRVAALFGLVDNRDEAPF